MSSPEKVSFTYNISFTAPANGPHTNPKLTAADLWLGIAHVAHSPQEFAPYVKNCDVLWQAPNRLGRAVTLAEGAVHKSAGEVIHQEVKMAEGLSVEAETRSTGAKTVFLLSYNCDAHVSPHSTDISFIVIYELKLVGVVPGSEEAKKIETDYPELARGACTSTLEQIRQCKADGRLEKWACGS